MESFKNQIKGKKKTEKIKLKNILETNGPFWKWFFFSFLGSREGFDKSTNIQKTIQKVYKELRKRVNLIENVLEKCSMVKSCDKKIA